MGSHFCSGFVEKEYPFAADSMVVQMAFADTHRRMGIAPGAVAADNDLCFPFAELPHVQVNDSNSACAQWKEQFCSERYHHCLVAAEC